MERYTKQHRLDIIYDGLSANRDFFEIRKQLEPNIPPEKIRGNISEELSQTKLPLLLPNLVESVDPGTEQDDANGIDGWIHFFPHTIHKSPLPLQVKSSDIYVAQFLRSQKYSSLVEKHGGIVVLNMRASSDKIIESFHEQLLEIDKFI